MNGWRSCSIGEILSLEYGKPLPKNQRSADGKYPIYGANGIKGRSDKFYRAEPSIIVGRKGSAGEVNLTEECYWPLDVTYFAQFDNSELDLMFIYHLLKKLNLQSLAKGVKPGINRNDVYALKVKIPPIKEQKRIVKILDKAFAAIDQAKANAEKNLQNAKELFDSYLNKVFTEKGEGWVDTVIEEACESITDCVNKTAPKEDEPTPYKMIRTTNVRHGKITLNAVKYVTKETYKIWTRRQVPKRGDLILTREAPMGEVGILDSDEKIFLGQRLVSYRVDKKRLKNRFLLYAMLSRVLQDQIHSMASGSTVQHMRVPDTKKLLLPLPSIAAQKRVVENIDAINFESEKLSLIYSKKLSELAELKKSVLQKAFTGEL